MSSGSKPATAKYIILALAIIGAVISAVYGVDIVEYIDSAKEINEGLNELAGELDPATVETMTSDESGLLLPVIESEQP